MYGGRAIDLFDRRVLNTYMDEYMGDFIFDKFQPFYFHRTSEVSYYIPTANEKEAPPTGLPIKEIALGEYRVIWKQKKEEFFIESTRNQLFQKRQNVS